MSSDASGGLIFTWMLTNVTGSALLYYTLVRPTWYIHHEGRTRQQYAMMIGN